MNTSLILNVNMIFKLISLIYNVPPLKLFSFDKECSNLEIVNCNNLELLILCRDGNLPIRNYHDTLVPIRYVLQSFFRILSLQVLRFDIAMLRFCF